MVLKVAFGSSYRTAWIPAVEEVLKLMATPIGAVSGVLGGELEFFGLWKRDPVSRIMLSVGGELLG